MIKEPHRNVLCDSALCAAPWNILLEAASTALLRLSQGGIQALASV